MLTYSYREHALRRTRDAFREYKSAPGEQVDSLYKQGLEDLAVLKRQTVIDSMFKLDRLVVEGGKEGRQKGRSGDRIRVDERQD